VCLRVYVRENAHDGVGQAQTCGSLRDFVVGAEFLAAGQVDAPFLSISPVIHCNDGRH
jgi:hypothetical protein